MTELQMLQFKRNFSLSARIEKVTNEVQHLQFHPLSLRALTLARFSSPIAAFVYATRNTLFCFQRLTLVFRASVVTFVASRGAFHALGGGVRRVVRKNRARSVLRIVPLIALRDRREGLCTGG